MQIDKRFSFGVSSPTFFKFCAMCASLITCKNTLPLLFIYEGIIILLERFYMPNSNPMRFGIGFVWEISGQRFCVLIFSTVSTINLSKYQSFLCICSNINLFNQYIYGYDFKGKATICNASDDAWSFGRGCNNVCIFTK